MKKNPHDFPITRLSNGFNVIFIETTLFFVSIYFQLTQSITKIQKTVTCLNRFGNKRTDQDKHTILSAGGKTENAVHQAQWFNIL